MVAQLHVYSLDTELGGVSETEDICDCYRKEKASI